MVVKELTPDLWPMLNGTELETVYPHLDPARAKVLVVEDEGRIVACWSLLQVYHVEGVWIAPEHRKRGKVALRLLEGMRTLCQGLGIARVVTGACTDDVKALIRHLRGVKLDGESFVIGWEG